MIPSFKLAASLWSSRLTPVTIPEWESALPSIRSSIASQLQSEEKRHASFATSTPDVWSYWDFIYFSIIVQTTVGLGDILPNSTAVRVIVAGQILVGYAVLVVVLNIALG